MSELVKETGKGYSKQDTNQTPGNVSANPVQEAAKGTQGVRDITREQWFWDTAVLS